MEPQHRGIMDEEEALRIGILPAGKGHWVRLKMRELEAGQYLPISRADWNRVNKTPNEIVKNENEKGGKQYELLQMADLSGWFVKRIA